MGNNILDKFLKIEEDPRLYEFKFKFKGVHFWPLVRYEILYRAYLEYSELPLIYTVSKGSLWTKIKFIIDTVKFYPYRVKHHDIVFFESNVGNILKDGRYFNRLIELFACRFAGNTLIMEKAYNFTYRSPRTYDKVYSSDALTLWTRIKTKLKKLYYKPCNEDVEPFIEFLKGNFPHKFKDDFWDRIRLSLMNNELALPSLWNDIEGFLTKVKPKLVIMNDACYGRHAAVWAAALRENGVVFAECQHGLIALDHIAYNYPPKLCDAHLRYLPHYFLAYGEFWKNNCRLPFQVLAIGNPYLSAILRNKKNIIKEGKKFLFASYCSKPSQIVDEVLYLKQHLPSDIELIFRIHPSEEKLLDDVYLPIIDAGIKIDRDLLYNTLANATYVCGQYSTVLFEAAGFQCACFNLGSHGVLDMSCFNVVENVEEVVARIKNNDFTISDKNDLWESDWETRYDSFIREILKN